MSIEPQSPRLVGSAPAAVGSPTAAVSRPVADPDWDEFLRRTPCGQFQQSSLWAEYKSAEGWQHHRVVLTGATGIAGGFQILWKRTRLGRIGYVSKGPVAPAAERGLQHRLRLRLVDAARELKLAALVAQDPDEASFEAGPCDACGFVQSNPMQTIETTYLIDVSAGMDVVRSRMRPRLRRNIREGWKQGVTVREGTEADLPHFFRLMAATCARHKTTPNPASLDALRRLWRIFSPSKSIRLTLVEREGHAPAALLCLLFGNRVSLWKEGWDGSQPHWHAGALLEEATFEWAHANGYTLCDICGISRSTALHLLSGKAVTAGAISSRDLFNVRFGGYPKLLPPALVYLPNPVLRWGYRNIVAPWEHSQNGSSRFPAGPVQGTLRTQQSPEEDPVL